MNVRRALHDRLANRDMLGRRAFSLLLVGIIHLLGFLLLLSLAPDMVRKLTPELKSFPCCRYRMSPPPRSQQRPAHHAAR